MYEKLIKEYVNKLTEADIKKYAMNYGMDLNDNETKILFLYAKNYWYDFYKGNPIEIINELREKLRPHIFNRLYSLYLENKNKIK